MVVWSLPSACRLAANSAASVSVGRVGVAHVHSRVISVAASASAATEVVDALILQPSQKDGIFSCGGSSSRAMTTAERHTKNAITLGRARSRQSPRQPPRRQLHGTIPLSSNPSIVSQSTLRRRRRYGRPETEETQRPPDRTSAELARQKKQRDKPFGALLEPHDHGEGGSSSPDEYLKKASLSPWVPVSDSVARKVMDLAEMTSDDIHVDLGSGDGRVCFHAIDYARVKKSTGIDVDESIVRQARDRLSKRHPAPPLTFVVADLLDRDHPVWDDTILQATVITMYFETTGLELLRPVLEEKLVGRSSGGLVRIICTGYPMPGWESRREEVVLGTQIHVYEWGSDDDNESAVAPPLHEDDLLLNRPAELVQENIFESNKFGGAKIIDRTGRYPIRGFNPNIFSQEEEDDDDWDDDDWDDDDGKEDDEKEEGSGEKGRK